MTRWCASLRGRVVTLVLVAAFLAAGLAHRVPLPLLDPGLAAFFAIGGTADDLCGGGAMHAEQGCEACRLAGAPLPGRACVPALRAAWSAYRPPLAPERRAPASGPRGPLAARGPPAGA